MILLLLIVSSLSDIILSYTSDKMLFALMLSFLRIGSDKITLHPSTLSSIASFRCSILFTSESESIPFSVASLVPICRKTVVGPFFKRGFK